MIEALLSLPLLIIIILIYKGRRRRIADESLRFLTKEEATAMSADILISANLGDVVVVSSRTNRKFVQFIIDSNSSKYIPIWDVPIEFASKKKVNQLKQFLRNAGISFEEKTLSGVHVIHSYLGRSKADIDGRIRQAIDYAQIREPIDLWVGNVS